MSSVIIISGLLFTLIGFNLQGQNISLKNNDLYGVWSDKGYLDSLNSHYSITLASQQEGILYNGIYVKNDTLIQALFPEAMEEDWLYYNLEKKQFENSRGAIKIVEVINRTTIKAKVQFEGETGIKHFIKVIPEQQAANINDALQLHFQYLYRVWFAGNYRILNSEGLSIGKCIFTKQGNAEGFIDDCLFAFFQWDDDNAILSLENWRTKQKIYYTLTYEDSVFLLDELQEPEWGHGSKPLIKTGKRIRLRKTNNSDH